MSKGIEFGPDVDLDAEEVYTPDGQRLTNERVAELVEDAVTAVRSGRPSLTGGDAHSPHVSFRVPEQLGRRAAERAEREGKSVSQLGREALEQYLSET